METIYDVMKDRLQVTETTVMVLFYPVLVKGIRLFMLKMEGFYTELLLKGLL